jgi:phage repressor protein C with HTH and peptisase S24 domain
MLHAQTKPCKDFLFRFVVCRLGEVREKAPDGYRHSCLLVPESVRTNSEFTVTTEHDHPRPYAEMGARLRAERDRLRLKQNEFADKVGVSKTAQFNYEVGERAVDAVYLQRAAELGMDTLYVVTGVHPLVEDDFVVIPRYAVAASAGHGYLVTEPTVELPGLSFSRRWLGKRGLAATKLRVVDVTGDSMAARLNHGDQVLMDVGDTSPRSGRAYVLRQGEELLVKYCQLLPGGILRVSSENTAYPSYDVDLSKTYEVAILGRVVASMHEW